MIITTHYHSASFCAAMRTYIHGTSASVALLSCLLCGLVWAGLALPFEAQVTRDDLLVVMPTSLSRSLCLAVSTS